MESKIKMKPGFVSNHDDLKFKNFFFRFCIVVNLEHYNQVINIPTNNIYTEDRNIIGMWKLKKLKQDAKHNPKILPKKQHHFR